MKEKQLFIGWGKLVTTLAFVVSVVSACVRAPLRNAQNSTRRASTPDLVSLKDDLPFEPLVAAVETEVAFLQNSTSQASFIFGDRVISRAEYLAGLKRFAELARTLGKTDEFFKTVEREFDFYEVYGDPNWGDVFMTSYYEPYIQASTKKTALHTQPLYGEPSDLISVDLSVFDEKFASERKYRGRVELGKLLPYYTREEIDARGALKNRKLELFWVDSVDSFMLQVQGSGTLDLGNGKLVRVGYANKNGHRYESVGKFLKSVIPEDQLNLQNIERYLRSLPKDEMQQYLNYNPSYVFFKVVDKPAITSLGVSATDGRTIATDPKYFQKGALGFLMTTKPKFESGDAIMPSSWEPLNRFVLDQDIGGAITGGGRLDLFWGRGDDAKRNAGVIKQRGKLFYLAPRQNK